MKKNYHINKHIYTINEVINILKKIKYAENDMINVTNDILCLKNKLKNKSYIYLY